MLYFRSDREVGSVSDQSIIFFSILLEMYYEAV